MKGVVFTEYVEFIEEIFGFDVVDDMIEKAGVSGIYTQAGNYEFSDLFKMVQALATIVDKPVGFLVEAFAKHLFKKLIVIYPKPVQEYTNAFDFIANIDDVVHPEVKKLYPEAELPSFDMVSQNDRQLIMLYKSTKPLMDLAKGLMEACAEHYKEDITITYKVLPKTDQYFKAEFHLIKK